MFNSSPLDIRVELRHAGDPLRSRVSFFDNNLTAAQKYAARAVQGEDWSRADLIVARWDKSSGDFEDRETFTYRRGVN